MSQCIAQLDDEGDCEVAERLRPQSRGMGHSTKTAGLGREHFLFEHSDVFKNLERGSLPPLQILYFKKFRNDLNSA